MIRSIHTRADEVVAGNRGHDDRHLAEELNVAEDAHRTCLDKAHEDVGAAVLRLLLQVLDKVHDEPRERHGAEVRAEGVLDSAGRARTLGAVPVPAEVNRVHRRIAITSSAFDKHGDHEGQSLKMKNVDCESETE